MIEITDPEDRKILTLARSARARTGAAQGACLRDTDGRTYAAAGLELPSLRLTAVQVVVAMAASSGAPGAEAVALLADPPEVGADDLAAVRDLAGPGVTVLVGSPDGSVHRSLTS
jgi:hypothetical protein